MSKRAPPFTEQCDAGDKTLGRFIEAPQDAQTGQPKLTRIEVRHWDSNAGLFKIIHKSCHAEHDNLCFWETLEE